jgi:hypothetical protein
LRSPPLKRLQSSTQTLSTRASEGGRRSARGWVWHPLATMRAHGCGSTSMADPLECLGGAPWERWGSASTFPQDGSTWERLGARQDTQSAPRARAVNCPLGLTVGVAPAEAIALSTQPPSARISHGWKGEREGVGLAPPRYDARAWLLQHLHGRLLGIPWESSLGALRERLEVSPGWKHVGASGSVTGHAECTASAGRGLSMGHDRWRRSR